MSDETAKSEDNGQVNNARASESTETRSHDDVENGQDVTTATKTEEAPYTIFTRNERYFLVFMNAIAAMFRSVEGFP